VVCLTEHRSKEQEIETLSIDHYTFGAKFWRRSIKHGDTGIFVHESVAIITIDLQEFCVEQDIETCAVKLNLPSTMIFIICIYRSPTAIFVHFIKGLDSISNQFSKQNSEIIVCGNTNIDHLDVNCYERQRLDALLATLNLVSTVRLPTRSLNGSISAIDNIFIDIPHEDKYTLYPVINGLSDHNGQVLQLDNISMQTQLSDTRIIQNTKKHNIHGFQMKLSYEMWDTIYGENDVNKIFNDFHNTFLKHFLLQAFLKRKNI
jgi:exonuclease III